MVSLEGCRTEQNSEKLRAALYNEALYSCAVAIGEQSTTGSEHKGSKFYIM
jgi:hypothetical protein